MIANEFLTIRPAKLKDVVHIFNLIEKYAKEGLMLSKSRNMILNTLLNYLVCESDDLVVGCCGVKIWIDEYVEIISLATSFEKQNQGIGTKLLQANIERAKNLGFKKIIALTVVPELFLRNGFILTDQNNFSNKIWEDCKYCTRNKAEPGNAECNETAVKMVI